MSFSKPKQLLKKASESFRRARTTTGSSEGDQILRTPPQQISSGGPVVSPAIVGTSSGPSPEVTPGQVTLLPPTPPRITTGTKLPMAPVGCEWALVKDPMSGGQTLQVVEVPSLATTERTRTWDHFDGLHCAPSDFFIDLVGDRTDHAPDVRPYLVYIGQHVSVELIANFSSLAEQEAFYVKEGKEYLRSAWEGGIGIFIKPRVELLALNQGPDRTMPWASLARSHLPHKRRRIDGDVGFEKNDDSPNSASMTHLPGEVLLTNIRVPLPPNKYLVINPVDHKSQWNCMVLANYQNGNHPAMQWHKGHQMSVCEMQLDNVPDGCVTDAWKEHLYSVFDAENP